MEEIKKEQANVRSFRVTDDVMSRFKEIQSEMDLTQDAALRMLVDAYELEQAKSAIPDRETEIANFQAKANELVEAFLYSLQLNQDAEVRIRSEVALQLQSKDKIIMNLQERLEAQIELAVASNTAAMEAENKQKQAEQAMKEALKQVDEHKKTAEDKTKLEEMWREKFVKAEAELKEYPGLKAENEERAHEIERLQQELKDSKREAEIQLERAVTNVQKEMDKAMNELEREKDKRIMELEIALSRTQASADEIQKQFDRLDKKYEKLFDERFEIQEDLHLIQYLEEYGESVEDFLRLIDEIKEGNKTLADYEKNPDDYDEEAIEFLKIDLPDWEEKYYEILADWKSKYKKNLEKEIAICRKWLEMNEE